MQVNMHEAKSQLSALAEKVWRGERVFIAKAGKLTIATPAKKSHR